MKNTFYYGYSAGVLLILWIQLIESFKLESVLILNAGILMCNLICLLMELDK